MNQWTRADHPCGIFPDVPEELYHASAGLSQSQLKLLGEEGGPARFRYGERKETEALKLGSLEHAILLEPDSVLRRYHITQLTREGTNAWKEQASEAEAAGKIIVKQTVFDQAMAMADAVYRWSSVARELLSSPDQISIEQSFWWVDEESGLLMRGRADLVHHGFQVILDPKTARSATRDGFLRAVYERKYHIQNAMYQDGYPAAGGWTPTEFIFLAIEPVAPYLTASYTLKPKRIQEGRDEIRRLIRTYQYCEQMNEWPGLDPHLQEL